MSIFGISIITLILLTCIAILVFVVFNWLILNYGTINSSNINSLNATDPAVGGGLRKLYRMSFNGTGTQLIAVTVPANACTISFNYSILPNASNIDAVIKIGTDPSGPANDDFGTATIVNKGYEDAGSFGTINFNSPKSALSDICDTVTLFVSVEVTYNINSFYPVTFLIEQISTGYFSVLNS